MRLITIFATCTKCAGRGVVPHRHITNKRNNKQCDNCEGKGEKQKLISVP